MPDQRAFVRGARPGFVHFPKQPFTLKAAPLALTDEQLTQVMRHAAVLHPQLRRVFVEHVAYELRGRTIGDGVVFRACAKVLKESGMFDRRCWTPAACRASASGSGDWPISTECRSHDHPRDLPRNLQAEGTPELSKLRFRRFPYFGVAHVVQKLVSLPSQPVKPRKTETDARL
jgi:hypothetical protein